MKLDTIGKSVNLAIRWLLSAAYKRGDTTRPVLQCIHVDNEAGFAVTSHGFAAHFINLDEGVGRDVPRLPESLDSRNWLIDRPNINNWQLEANASENTNFPDMQDLIPRTEPALVIGFNPQLLLKTLSEMEGIAAFAFHGPTAPFEVFGRLKGDKEHGGFQAYALVMPMHLDNSEVPKDLHWKPEAKKVDDDSV